MLFRLPTVYAPQHDSRVLGQAVAENVSSRAQCRVLDLCAGTGFLSLVALGAGADGVVAVDVSRAAGICIAANSRLRRVRIDVRIGDLFEPVRGEKFELIACNPPYVPAPSDIVPDKGARRNWDAGRDGRAVIDRICAESVDYLSSDGQILMVQSSLSSVEKTLYMFEERGMRVEILSRSCTEFGPVVRSREEYLRSQGLLADSADREDLVVISARI